MNSIRLALASLLLAGTGMLLHLRNPEIIPSRERLVSFPKQLREWKGTDLEIPKDVSEVLGSGDFLFRNYSDVASQPPVNLFIAYFPSQRFGDTIHSPKNCLPGAGWSPLVSSHITLFSSGERPFEVNRYLVAKGRSRALVLYWYWAHGRAVASEYWAKYYLVADSIRLNRSDGSLIRVVTQLNDQESAAVAQRRMISLLNNVIPVLESYIPR